MIVFMPVRGSKRVLKILPEISSQVDRVFIQATEVEFSSEELPRNVVVDYSVVGLSNKRHRGMEIAQDMGEDFIFQIDDDISADFAKCLLSLERILIDNPWIASASTMPGLLSFYAKGNSPSEGDFSLSAFPTQFWGMRVEAYKELKYGFRAMSNTNALEDLYVGLEMWDTGFANATVPQLTHDHKRRRLNPKNRAKGGMPPLERDGGMQEALTIIENRFEGNVLKFAKLTKTKHETYKFMPRYNWTYMAECVRNRWGNVGYVDHRMEI